jgi:hypothetical protein
MRAKVFFVMAVALMVSYRPLPRTKPGPSRDPKPPPIGTAPSRRGRISASVARPSPLPKRQCAQPIAKCPLLIQSRHWLLYSFVLRPAGSNSRVGIFDLNQIRTFPRKLLSMAFFPTTRSMAVGEGQYLLL